MTAAILGTLSCAGGDTNNPTGMSFNGAITGSVTVDGAPFPGATIRLSGGASRSAQTNAAGSFSFSALGQGAYVVELTNSPTEIEFTTSARAVTLSTSQPTAQASFQGSTRRDASITVVVSVDAAPLEAVVVGLSGPETASGATDVAGSVTFHDLPAGLYTTAISGFDVEEFAFPETSIQVNAQNDQVAQVLFSGVVVLHPPDPVVSFTATSTGPQTVELVWTSGPTAQQGSVESELPSSTDPVQNLEIGSTVSGAPGAVSEYRVDRRISGNGSWNQLVVVPAGTASYTDNGLLPATSYSYRARACNEAGCSPFSNESSTTTDPVPPTEPSQLAGSVIGPNLIAISWADASDDETEFRVERRVGAEGQWTLLTIRPAGSITHADDTVLPDMEYGYRVQACNAVGCSTSSNEITLNTPGIPPAGPVALTALANGASVIDLGWDDIASDELAFEIERRVGGAGPWSPLGSLPPDTESHSDTGLNPNTEYSYRVRACNGFGCSVFSNQASATTTATPPVAPSSLTAVAAGSFSIDLAWIDNSSDETGFRIESHPGPDDPWTLLTTQPAGSTTFSVNGLDPDSEYFYRVSACSDGECSATSNTASATTDPVPGGPNLNISAAYLVQRTQRLIGDVPMVKDLDAYVRVFATANSPNTLQPEVRVRFYQNGTLVHTETIAAATGSVPQSVDESNKATSWNATIPAALIQPGLSFLADVDPTNAIVEGSEADNFFPPTGTPQAIDVWDTPSFDVTFIPVRQSVNGLVGDVNGGNIDQFMRDVRKMFPIAEDNTVIHAEVVTDQPALQSSNTNGAWGAILSEINAIRTAEGSSRNYYGVVNTTYSSGVAGIGYVGWPTALGWDHLPSGSGVAVHEWGHNAARPHSPGCGAGGPDPNYPHADGKIGVWGIDMATLTLRSPSTRFDLMTYCSPEWISDYVYEKVMQNRQGSAGAGAPGFGIGSGASTGAGAGRDAAGGISGSGNSGSSLLVWGRVENGQVILEPAFIVDAPPQLPANPGAYTVEGLDTTGGRLFAFSFEPIPVADATLGEGHFAFTVPMSAFPNGDLVELRVTGDGSVSGIQRSSFDGVPGGAATPAAVAAQASVTAGPGGTVDLEWDAAQYPMALIRDAETGEILSFARGGSASFIPVSDRVELLFSDGIRSSERLIRSWR